MNFQYSPYGAVLLISAVIVLSLSIYSFQKRSSRMHVYFSLLLLSSFVWCFASAMEFFTIEMSLKIIWIQISYIGVTTAAPLWLIVVLSYSRYEKYLKPKNIGLLMIIPLIVLVLAFTNSWHNLVWPSITPTSDVPGALLIYAHGPAFWLNILYSFIMILLGVTILFQTLISSSKIYRSQIYLLLLSGFSPIIFSLLYISDILPIAGLDITPFGLAFSGILISIDIFLFNFLDIRPIVHEVLFKSMKNCFLVFDAEDILVEINSASRFLGIYSESIGKKSEDVFTDLPDLNTFYNGELSEKEIFLGKPWNLWLQVQLTSICENQDKLGKLIVIQDITRRKTVEKELSNIEDRYEVLTELSPDSIAVLIDNKIVFANNASAILLGAESSQELIGKEILSFIHPDFEEISKKRLNEVLVERKSLDFIEERIITLNGEEKDIEIGDVPIIFNNQPAAQIVVRDITERKKLESQLKKSLNEKDLMMKEIHHRVKNNLMVIQSLLNLQSKYIKDEQALNIFKESQNRAKSMALIHQRLYQSTDLKRIEFGEYTRALTMDLFRSYVRDGSKIHLNIEVEKVMLDINTAIPLGLILNELVSNVLKYAFPSDMVGNLNVKFHQDNSGYRLIVSDDGVGIPEGLDYEDSDSLGLKLIYNLSEQIGAKVTLDRSKGTHFEIRFKEQPVVPE
ncbi:histidine kinase N-terminal 7TM domain-containing protein [Methanobacterium alcaliphilum]|uniref:histidine kinase N-terminal 7TM domain-containing protein n=1 Tax=Methanobacterium alcaliphilum TaxID=392018 RepID=UPI00200A503F|nr:histidine kinase N-terminal 7TM domain-containing protein [Methanobacterium alcaliphilum]MCK9152070.1 PAS domain S-box protein [Methanobacterium alcaliphilum]